MLMVEEVRVSERQEPERIEPSYLRPGAQYFELVKARNSKNGNENNYLYWWDRDSSQIMLEEVNAGGVRVVDTPLVRYQAEDLKTARRKIAADINEQRKRGLEITRHQRIDPDLFEKGRTEQGMLIPYLKELINEKDRNIEEARKYFGEAKRKLDEERTGESHRSSVSGPSLSRKFLKQEVNLRTGLNDKVKSLRYLNHYLNKRVYVNAPSQEYEELYDEYARYNRQLADLARLARTENLEEKDKVIKEYEDVFKKRLNLHNRIAEQSGYPPLKGIPEDYPLGVKPKLAAKPKSDEKPSNKTTEKPKEPAIENVYSSEPENLIRSHEIQPDQSGNGVGPTVREEAESIAIKDTVEVKETEPEKVEEDETPKPSVMDEIAETIKEKGVYKKEFKEDEVKEIFQDALNGLVSRQDRVESETKVTSLNISIKQLSLKTTLSIESPFEIDFQIDYSVGKTTEAGKLAQRQLEIIVEPRGRLSLSQRIKIEAAQIYLRGKLMKPTETIMEGLNYELQQRGYEVKISDIRFELEEGLAEISIRGEK